MSVCRPVCVRVSARAYVNSFLHTCMCVACVYANVYLRARMTAYIIMCVHASESKGLNVCMFCSCA